jgi:LPXTG-motif cell wall-anchored protein
VAREGFFQHGWVAFYLIQESPKATTTGRSVPNVLITILIIVLIVLAVLFFLRRGRV